MDEEKKDTFDPVNSPKHYANSKVECIDAMADVFGKEAVMSFALLNFLNICGVEKIKITSLRIFKRLYGILINTSSC